MSEALDIGAYDRWSGTEEGGMGGDLGLDQLYHASYRRLVVQLDVTDAGVVARTADGGIWFTDGQELEQVGTLGESGSAYADPDFPFGSSWGFVVSDNTGARAAWLEFPQPGEPELVVYDTENAEETAREPLGVDPGSYALLVGVTDRYGYWYSNPESIEDEPFPDQRIDLGSGRRRRCRRRRMPPTGPGPTVHAP